MREATLAFLDATYQFIDEFEAAVIDLLPAFAADALADAEMDSPLVSLIQEHGRACLVEIVDPINTIDPVEAMKRAAQEAARLIAAKVGGGVVIVFSGAGMARA
jgi:hypothetical protein